MELSICLVLLLEISRVKRIQRQRENEERPNASQVHMLLLMLLVVVDCFSLRIFLVGAHLNSDLRFRFSSCAPAYSFLQLIALNVYMCVCDVSSATFGLTMHRQPPKEIIMQIHSICTPQQQRQ